jgi:catechol 2,3-dioxygenase-like lactoylglutathione lyase family enzyme
MEVFMEMKLEVVPIGVSDVDRAKAFYVDKLGFHADVDMPLGDKRYVQLTPPGSACSISLGVGITKTKPGEIDGLLLVVKISKQSTMNYLAGELILASPKWKVGAQPIAT